MSPPNARTGSGSTERLHYVETDVTRHEPEDQPMTDTLVAFLLDRSGSMINSEHRTLAAFAAYLDRLRQEPSIRFSLVTFDSVSTDVLVRNEPIGNVPSLTRESFRPGMLTPLVDASYKLIKAIEKAIASYAEQPRVVICIHTDGTDNASTEYTFHDLKELIRQKIEDGWQINFMAVGLHDAYRLAHCMGIPSDWTISYGENAFETSRAFVALADNTVDYVRRKRHVTCFTYAQREMAGDWEGLMGDYAREGVYTTDKRGGPDVWVHNPDPHPLPPDNAPPVVKDFEL